MSSPQLIQIVPPGHGGVRDYLECLKSQWAQSGIESHVIELSQTLASTKSLLDRVLSLVDAGTQPNSQATFSLLIHFSGYGYEQRGLCFWLLREIERAKARLGNRLRVVTMFHELFASGPPWGSAFWLSPLQARIARKLACLSDAIWTNTELHGRWLRERVGPSTPITVQPVFSNVGEPEHPAPVSDREPSLVVFGSTSTRRRALAALPRHAGVLQRLGITEIIEVGSGQPTPWSAEGLSLRFLGRLEQADLGALLGRSAYGLIEYPPKYLGKSGVFAAYCAYGCVVLNASDSADDSDGLQAGVHFVNLSRSASLTNDVRAREAMALVAQAWYEAHALSRQAEAFATSCAVHPLQGADRK